VILSVEAGFPIHIPSIELFGLVDEHDGNVIPDFIKKPALITDEPVTRLVEMNLTLAFRAGENLQKLWFDGHDSLLSAGGPAIPLPPNPH
jgi:hypothetical protein